MTIKQQLWKSTTDTMVVYYKDYALTTKTT